MKRRKGFSLVETMVAVTLSLLTLAIVTAVVTTATNTSKTVRMEQAAVEEVENIVVCFQSRAFDDGLRLLYDDPEIPAGRRYTMYFDGRNKYLSFGTTYGAVWQIDCVRTTTADGRDQLTVTATEIESGEVLYTDAYTKAAA